MTGHEFLRVLTVFFGDTRHESAIFFLVVVPFFVFFIALLFMNKNRGSRVSFDKISEGDMQTIETIRLQKGLEAFDRDFLIELALNQNEKPYYLLIDLGAFERAQAGFKLFLVQNGESPEANRRYKLLLKLKKKLFNC